MTKVVRPLITSLSAAVTFASVAASSALVASSRIRIGGSFNSARAIDSRWRSPPESMRPRSPTVEFSPSPWRSMNSSASARWQACKDLRIGRVRIADAQILGDRAVEQKRLLEDHADIAPETRELDVADVATVDADLAGLRIVDAVEQRHRRRFACAGRADERNGLAWLCLEGKVLDRRSLAVIGEGDAVEGDLAAHLLRASPRSCGPSPTSWCRARRRIPRAAAHS